MLPAGERHIETRARKRERAYAADAGARAGDERDLAVAHDASAAKLRRFIDQTHGYKSSYRASRHFSRAASLSMPPTRAAP